MGMENEYDIAERVKKQFKRDLENFDEGYRAGYGESVIKCKDCKYQQKAWHVDKRMKEGGYWVYNCDLISDPFVSTPVCGIPDQFCSSAERKGGAK